MKPVFNILSVQYAGNSIEAILSVDAFSEIFQGHFPDQAVVPGACMLQMVKDLLAGTLKTQMRLLKADNIKFLNLITPAADSLQLKINYQQINGQLKVSANLVANEIVCMKFSGIFSY